MKGKDKYYFKLIILIFSILLTILSPSNILSDSTERFIITSSNYPISLYLTESTKYKFGESPIEKELIEKISNAKDSITIFAFDFDNANLIDALIKASQKNIKIKIICDLNNTPEQVLNLFQSQGWLVYYKSKKLMHHKIIIFDEDIVGLGSMNFTISCMYGNNNDFYFINSKKVAQFLKNYFDYLAYKKNKEILRTPITIDGITFYFANSPYYNINDFLIDKINKSKERIILAYSTFTNNKVANEIIKNIESKKLFFFGLLEKRNAYSKYSVYSTFLNNNHHIYLDRNDYYMHHKLMIIDNTIITGSYAISDRTNSTESIEFNDDLSFSFEDKEIADFLLKYLKNLILQ